MQGTSVLRPQYYELRFSGCIDHLAERDLRFWRQCPHFSFAVFWHISLRILSATEGNTFDLLIVNIFNYILANVAEKAHKFFQKHASVSHRLWSPFVTFQSITNRNSSSWTAVTNRTPQWTTVLISTHKTQLHFNFMSSELIYKDFMVFIPCIYGVHTMHLWCSYRAFSCIQYF